MNMNDLMLQMAAASQLLQNTMPIPGRDTASKPEGEKSEFHSLLDKKRTESVDKTTQEQPSNTQGTQTVQQQDQTAQAATGVAQQVNTVPLTGLPLTQNVVPVDMQMQTPVQPVAEMQGLPQAVQTTPVPVVAQTQEQAAPETLAAPMQNVAAVVAAPNQEEQAKAVAPELPKETADVAPEVEEAVVTTATKSAKQSETPEMNADSKSQQQSDLDGDLAQAGGAQQRLFANSEVMPQRVGDAPTLDTQSADFDEKLEQTVHKMMTQGEQRVEIQLNPDNLGRLVIEMSKNPEGVLHVVLRADNEQALKLLTEHSNSLGLMLQNSQQGEVRVEVQRSQQNEQPWQQPDQNGGQNQEGRQQQERRRQPQAAETFLQQLRLGLLPS